MTGPVPPDQAPGPPTPGPPTAAPPAAALADRVRGRLRRTGERILDSREGDGAMVGVAAAVGIATGLLAVLMILLVDLASDVAFGPRPAAWQIVAVPVLGGLVTGLLVSGVPAAAGGGISEVMRAIALHGGRLDPLTPLAKVAATGLALGTGAAGGREGPIVHVGGAVGSALSGALNLDDERRRTLVAAGAAAGIAASFNAPIGGMLFAMEVIIGGFKVRSLQVVVIASVLASVVARQLLGEGLIYDTRQSYVLADPRELLLYALLGVAAVAVARALMDGTARAGAAALRSRVPRWLHPAMAGGVVGLLALGLPEVLGSGDRLPPFDGPLIGLGTDPIRAMIEGGPVGGGWTAVGLLVVLLLGKLLATTLTLASGSPVGSFAPSLFLGAALGGTVGHLALVVLPGIGIRPGAYALVGMAAVVGAIAKAPLTGILIVFELTSDYGLVLPLMLATGLATFLADRLWQGSIYTRPLAAEGIVYAEPDDVDVLQTVTVGEVMGRDPLAVLADDPVTRLQEVFTAGGSHGHPVVDHRGRLVGVVTVSDLASRLGERDPALVRIGDIATTRVSTVTEDDPVFRAVRRMAALGVGRIPVVDPGDRGRLVGMIRRADLVQAYQRAITRSQGVQQRKDRARLRDLSGTAFAEVVIQPGSAADGHLVKDVAWPARTVLTGIRRGGDTITPAGDTALHAGDEVVFLTATGTVEEVRAVLADPIA